MKMKKATVQGGNSNNQMKEIPTKYLENLINHINEIISRCSFPGGCEDASQ